MHEIIKEAEPIALMRNVKQAILLYEHVFGHYPEVDLAELMSLYGIETQEEFEEVCRRIVTELNQNIQDAILTDEGKKWLNEQGYESFLELAAEDNFDLITSKYHQGKNFNEIANEVIVDSLITVFERIWEIDQSGQFYIRISNLAEEAIFFEDYDDLCSFVHNYDVAPYTVYEVRNNEAVRIGESK